MCALKRHPVITYYVQTSCYLKCASFSIFCTVQEYNPVVTKKKYKKIPDVRYTSQKTGCRYLYLYRNGKRKKSDHEKKHHPDRLAFETGIIQVCSVIYLNILTIGKQKIEAAKQRTGRFAFGACNFKKINKSVYPKKTHPF